MGSFLDYDRPHRKEWKFTYQGHQLLSAAKTKFEEVKSKLEDAQTRLQKAVAESGRLHKDPVVSQVEDEVERLGPRMEELAVFVHEFQRNPEREYHLSISDVTFFDLHMDVVSAEEATCPCSK